MTMKMISRYKMKVKRMTLSQNVITAVKLLANSSFFLTLMVPKHPVNSMKGLVWRDKLIIQSQKECTGGMKVTGGSQRMFGTLLTLPR